LVLRHLRGWEERRQAIAGAADKAGRTRELLARHGIDCPTVTGAGTFEFESASGVYTELQCGSYIFMDADYGRNRDRDGAPTKAFEPSLFVCATVMSPPTEDPAIVDAGLKAHAFDSRPSARLQRIRRHLRARHRRARPPRHLRRHQPPRPRRQDPPYPRPLRPDCNLYNCMSASATTASNNSGRSPRAARFIDAGPAGPDRWPTNPPSGLDQSPILGQPHPESRAHDGEKVIGGDSSDVL
jgi:hypothetical protein